MAKFRFRLATLLRLREATCDERRGELAEAYRVDEVLAGQVDQLIGEMEELHEQRRRAARSGAVDIDCLIATQRYELTLKTQEGKLAQQREKVAVEIERRRQRLIEAQRDVRVLEKLEVRQKERYRDEENRREIRELDEVAGQRAAREEVL